MREARFVLPDRQGGVITIEANGDAALLVLGGRPIEEPVVMHGRLPMNTAGEIRHALTGFQSGTLGRVAIWPYPAPVCQGRRLAARRQAARRQAARRQAAGSHRQHAAMDLKAAPATPGVQLGAGAPHAVTRAGRTTGSLPGSARSPANSRRG
ncbi:MAG: hypothetical protein IT556_04630 [Acetobacteraceae bacterium]|nr:hypothetical protein [Acetobacteraceae bacterium]